MQLFLVNGGAAGVCNTPIWPHVRMLIQPWSGGRKAVLKEWWNPHCLSPFRIPQQADLIFWTVREIALIYYICQMVGVPQGTTGQKGKTVPYYDCLLQETCSLSCSGTHDSISIKKASRIHRCSHTNFLLCKRQLELSFLRFKYCFACPECCFFLSLKPNPVPSNLFVSVLWSGFFLIDVRNYKFSQ